jgi:cobalamin synthase
VFRAILIYVYLAPMIQLILVFVFSLTAVLYFSLRVRIEGLNGDTLAAEIEEFNIGSGSGNYNNVSIEEAGCDVSFL